MPNERSTPEEMAFEMFAHAYPHEAAEADWPAFVRYTQKVNPEISEEAVREILQRTAASHAE